MNNIKRFIFSSDSKRAINILIYIVFFFLAISIIPSDTGLLTLFFYICIILALLSIVLLKEYLDFQVEKAIYFLNFDLDLPKAKAIFDRLQKIDIFNSYKSKRTLFDVLYNLTLFKPNETLLIIDQNDKYFKSSLDSLFIKNTSKFYAYAMLKDFENANLCFKEIVRLKDAKLGRKKISPLYSFEELEAIFFLTKKEFKKAEKAFKHVNYENMNPKEYLFVDIFKYLNYKLLHKSENSKMLNDIKTSANTVPVTLFIEEYLNESKL